jgi:hypothetical protein
MSIRSLLPTLAAASGLGVHSRASLGQDNAT